MKISKIYVSMCLKKTTIQVKMKASYFKYILHLKNPSGTSRGILTDKETWFIILEKDGKKGIGEC
jgi:hypothetical protein